ncbi:MAG: HAD-IIA family hydrolase [Sedimentisphaeraceae bacterium JB056]
MEEIRNKKAFICDMDGVIYHGRKLVDGAMDFINWLKSENKEFLFLTNSSERSPLELKHKLSGLGIDVEKEHFMTSAMATANFLSSQCPNGRVYVIGEAALSQEFYNLGFIQDDRTPDYVVVGETKSYSYDKLETAVNLVLGGAKLIGTNPDLTGPTETGIAPACRSLISPIELATGRQAYFIGKPNPLIMRHSLQKLQCRREETAIIGDRMDTDIIAGIESGIDTVLVMSGITKEADLSLFPYRPRYIAENVGKICS